MTMGSDFQYENTNTWFKNLDKLIQLVNAQVSVPAPWAPVFVSQGLGSHTLSIGAILVFYTLISYHKLSGLKQQQAYYLTVL